MPILSREPDLFPEELLDELYLPESAERLWWVLHTRPRQEKSLARELHRWRIPFYLPQVARRRLIAGRRFTAHVPLFAGYLFLLGDQEERVDAQVTRRVVRTLEVPDQEGFWGDLRQIERLIASGAPITPEDRLKPGKKVEIRSGPLVGLTGTIVRGASGRRFVVQVDFIQRGASVVVEDCLLVETDCQRQFHGAPRGGPGANQQRLWKRNV